MAERAACVHTRGGRAGREAMRGARSGRAGKGARRALCRPFCASAAARVCDPCECADERGARSLGVPGAARALRSSALRARTAGSTEGRRSGSGSGSGSGSRLPAPGSAGLPQRARTGAKPGRRRRSYTYSVAPRPPGRSAARAGARPGRGGSRELRRSPGTLPGARRALPALARPLSL